MNKFQDSRLFIFSRFSMTNINFPDFSRFFCGNLDNTLSIKIYQFLSIIIVIIVIDVDHDCVYQFLINYH